MDCFLITPHSSKHTTPHTVQHTKRTQHATNATYNLHTTQNIFVKLIIDNRSSNEFRTKKKKIIECTVLLYGHPNDEKTSVEYSFGIQFSKCYPYCVTTQSGETTPSVDKKFWHYRCTPSISFRVHREIYGNVVHST